MEWPRNDGSIFVLRNISPKNGCFVFFNFGVLFTFFDVRTDLAGRAIQSAAASAVSHCKSCHKNLGKSIFCGVSSVFSWWKIVPATGALPSENSGCTGEDAPNLTIPRGISPTNCFTFTEENHIALVCVLHHFFGCVYITTYYTYYTSIYMYIISIRIYIYLYR